MSPQLTKRTRSKRQAHGSEPHESNNNNNNKNVDTLRVISFNIQTITNHNRKVVRLLNLCFAEAKIVGVDYFESTARGREKSKEGMGKRLYTKR